MQLNVICHLFHDPKPAADGCCICQLLEVSDDIEVLWKRLNGGVCDPLLGFNTMPAWPVRVR